MDTFSPQPETFPCVLHDVIRPYLALLVSPVCWGTRNMVSWEWWEWADVGLNDLRDLNDSVKA